MCLYIYTLYLDNLVSRYCMIVLVVLFYFCCRGYCSLLLFSLSDDTTFLATRMAVAFGTVNAFNPSQDKWPLYVERLEHVFVANGITDGAKKQAVFLSVIGASNYKQLLSLVAPAKPREKEYSALVDKLTEHFTPAPSEIVERYKFHTSFRKSVESVAAFVSELRSIAKLCNFRETLETMLHDRIVCGINDTVIQCRLLSEKDLTFKTTLELAQSMESAAKNLKELSDSSQLKPPATAGSTPMHMVMEPVHQISANASAKSQPQCYCCGKKGHYAPTCKYKGSICNKCGHLQKVCRSKRTRPTQSTRPVNNIQDDETDEYQLLNITSSGKSPTLECLC